MAQSVTSSQSYEMSNISGLPPLPKCFNGLITTERTVSETSQGEVKEGTAHRLTKDVRIGADNSATDEDSVFDNMVLDDECLEEMELHIDESLEKSPIQSSLRKLRTEMVGLRKMDISLLCQLWSIHESIQEFKNFLMDTYSETGSEYTDWGLSSRASSMTSIDSFDLNDDFRLPSEPSLLSGTLDGSTTSLIQQIEDLKVRAESEF